jgi:YjbE family integral membrane protein
MDIVLLATLGETLPAWLDTAFGSNGASALALLEIIGINILLSGDNAVVIALACRSLPPQKRRIGIAVGVLAAIALRIVFTLGLQYVITWPWLKLVGGLLLIGIAIQLVLEAHEDDKVIAASPTLLGAIATIALADVVMSLDNVLAIAGAARGQSWLIVVGLALSIPLIVGGATLIISLLTRFPLLVWAGAALLGWIGGELIAEEPLLADALATFARTIGATLAQMPTFAAIAGAALVVSVGLFTRAFGRASA